MPGRREPSLLVGNDVVDLLDPDSLGRTDQPRYIERVLTPNERDRLAASDVPDWTFWSLWAAKEAAFKLLVKAPGHEGRARFVPRRFEVDLETSSVHHAGRRAAVRFARFGDAIHCWAAHDPAADVCWSVTTHDERDPRGCSELVRRHARAAAATVFGAAQDEIRVGVGAVGQPQLLLPSGRWDVSLSHHGRYLAFAFIRPPDPPALLASLSRMWLRAQDQPTGS